MTNTPRDRKISQFQTLTTIPSDAKITFVSGGTNYTIALSDFVSSIGVTGTIEQAGDPTGTPVLNQAGAVNQIRNVEAGNGILASVSPLNGAKIEHNFIQNTEGVTPVVDFNVPQPLFRSFTGSNGISVAPMNGKINFSLSTAPPGETVIAADVQYDDTVSQLGSTNVQGAIQILESKTPRRTVNIRQEEDFGPLVMAPDGVMRRFLEVNTYYIIDVDNLFLSSGLWLQDSSSPQFDDNIIFGSTSAFIVTYTGLATLFYGKNISRLDFVYPTFICVNAGIPFCDLHGKSTGSNLVSFRNTTIAVFGFCRFTNITFVILEQVAIAPVFGFLMHNVDSFVISQANPDNFSVGALQGAFFSSTGNFSSITFSVSRTFLSPSDSVLAVDSGANIGSLVNINFVNFTTGNFFQPDLSGSITQFQDLSILIGGSATSYTDDGFGSVEVTHDSGDVYLGLNVTHIGTTNYNGTFKIIKITGFDRYIMNATYVADEFSGVFVGAGSRVTTSAAHGIVDFRFVTISGTTNYDGVLEAHNANLISLSSTTFDIDTLFVADDATGAYLVSSRNEEDVRVNTEDNGALLNSKKIASIFFDPPTPETILGSGAAFTKVDGGVIDWETEQAEEFTTDVSGTATYIGINNFKSKVTASIAIEQLGGGSSLLEARVAVNGVTIPSSKGLTQNTTPTQVLCKAYPTLSPGDQIELFVTNQGGSADVVVTFAKLSIEQ